MKIKFIILVSIHLFISSTNSLMTQTLKVISKGWYSTEMVTEYETFIKNEKFFYRNFNYGNKKLIEDFRYVLNENLKDLRKIESTQYSKSNSNIRMAIIIDDQYGTDTIAYDKFLRYILINSDFYYFDWYILHFIKYKLSFQTNNEINDLYLYYYNSKRED